MRLPNGARMRRLIAFLLFSRLLFSTDYATVNIQGQLANQLFQTAAVIAYARDHGCEARFPTLKSAINAPLNIRYVFHRLDLSPIPEGTKFERFNEPAPDAYCDLPYEPGKNICFQGYFPSVKYFSHHSDYIRELFSPTQDLIDRIYEKYEEVLLQQTVAVHVRTFFPDSIDPNGGIGRTNWTYFINAMECFPDHYTFLVFSDRPDWVIDHFPRIKKNIHFIQGNPHYFDFYFMSLCNHFVLGPKSTFSWWAAWLNPDPDKTVIRPDDHWLPDDAFPSPWRKIKID